jgi:hypothetical protein
VSRSDASLNDNSPEGLPNRLAALEQTINTQLSAIADAIAELASRLEAVTASQPPPSPQWSATDLQEVAASLQYSLLQALSAFELSNIAPSVVEPIDAPATARDVARVNRRIDELRSLLLG